ncbi:MAG TPA: type III secretion protein HrpB4 [Trinickia sp.]|nr:type III secretion protein HrpB4 [Trinickia sp.]
MNGYDNTGIGALAGHDDGNGMHVLASNGLAEGDGGNARADARFAEGAGFAEGADAFANGVDAFTNGADAFAQDSQAAVAGDTAAAVAERLTGYYRCRRALFEWMHPQRLARLPYANRLRVDGHGDGAASYAAATAGTAALAEAFLDDAGIRVPPLESFAAPGAALARLPVHECLTVFRLRALVEYSDQVHSWIDRPRRALLADWIGPRGTRLLLGRRRDLAGDAVQSTQRAPLGADDGDTLAWQGFRLFERECGWASDGPLAIAQLALPDDADGLSPAARLPARLPAHLPAHLPAQPAALGWNPSLSIVSQLPDLFPEWSW